MFVHACHERTHQPTAYSTQSIAQTKYTCSNYTVTLSCPLATSSSGLRSLVGQWEGSTVADTLKHLSGRTSLSHFTMYHVIIAYYIINLYQKYNRVAHMKN